MDEFEYDQHLGIKTVGLHEVRNQMVHYNRYEATPFVALDALFEEYELMKKMSFRLCCEGKTPFYVNYHFKASVTESK
jgi:hypothetical protein